jgi:flagellar basal-body rod modification protein FlgD
MTIPAPTDSLTKTNSNPYAALNGKKSAATDPVSAAAAANSVDPNSAQGIQDRFLKLLTTQLKAQDPANPMDNGQITSQMAQISQVTGMENLNGTMKSLLSSQMSSQALLAAGTVGGQALVEGSTLVADGSGKPMMGGVSLEGAANSLRVDVQNSAGMTVASIDVKNPQPGMNIFNWDGKDSGGNPVPAGAYSYSVQASNAGKDGPVAVHSTAYANQTIKAVSWDNTGAPQLLLSGGQRVGMSAVQQIS